MEWLQIACRCCCRAACDQAEIFYLSRRLSFVHKTKAHQETSYSWMSVNSLEFMSYSSGKGRSLELRGLIPFFSAARYPFEERQCYTSPMSVTRSSCFSCAIVKVIRAIRWEYQPYQPNPIRPLLTLSLARPPELWWNRPRDWVRYKSW